MPSAFKIECEDCEESGRIVLWKGAAVDGAEAHHEATGHTVTVYDVFGDLMHELTADD